jgi:hypothetical protein
MTQTTNTFEIGNRVERLGSASDYTTGRKGEIVEIKDDRCRVKWDGNPRTWVNKKFLRVIEAKPVITVDELAFKAWMGEKKAQRQEWINQGERGQLSDFDNPAYLFSTTNTTLLTQIASGKVCPTFLASYELANRGLDKSGNWVGFAEAFEIHGLK